MIAVEGLSKDDLGPSQKAFDSVCAAQKVFNNSAATFCQTLIEIYENFGYKKYVLARDLYKRRYAAFLEAQLKDTGAQPWATISKKLANAIYGK